MFLLKSAANLGYWLFQGWGSVWHIEAWFYYGVMKGLWLPTGGLSDVTVHLLRAVGFFVPTVEGVVLLGVLASAITTWAIYETLKCLYSEKEALYGALVYVFLPSTAMLSLAGFTHSHIQFCLGSLAILCAVKSRFNEVYAVPMLIFLTTGVFINQEILVFAAATAAYGLSLKADAGKTILLAYVVCLAAAAIYVVEDSLSILPQGRLGSGDVKPTTPWQYLIRYHLFIPAILLITPTLKRINQQNMIGLCLLAAGIVMSLQMTRGTRLLDIGLAYTLAPYLRKKLLFTLTLLSIISVGYHLNNSHMYGTDDITATQWLQDKEGIVLAGWERGHMITALTGLQTVSTVGGINYPIHHMLSEDTGLDSLNRHNITYVFIADRDWQLIGNNKQRITGGLIQKPCETNNCLIYKLQYNIDYLPAYRNQKIQIYKVKSNPLSWN